VHLARALAAATVALLVACGTDTVHPPAVRGITYVRHFAGGRSEVWLLKDSGTRRRLAVGGILSLLSPDGRRVAFVDVRYDLYVVSTRGGNPRLLARSTWPTQWSPDSSFLLAKRIDEAPTTAIVTVDLHGDVTRVRRGYIGGFTLSPDGDEVCFDAVTARRDLGALSDLYVIDADGRNLRRLTHDASSASPVWSEHGIAFAKLVRPSRTRPLPNNAWGADEIWRIAPNGRGARRIARPPRNVLGQGIVGFAPEAWSRDGRRIVAALANEFGGPPFVIDVATGKIRRLGDYSYHAAVDGISQDGRSVLVEDRSVELNRWWRVDVIPYSGGRARLIARYAGGASWNR
jgi:Tol biopolymer transport system component